MDRSQRRRIVIRDTFLMLFGCAGLAHQTLIAAEASPILVPAFVSLILSPSGIAIWQQRNGTGPATTNGSSSSPPSSEQSASSSSP